MATTMTLHPLAPEKCSHNLCIRTCICYLKIGKIGVKLGVKTCEVFLCFLAIIFPRSIVLTSLWFLCITVLIRLAALGFYQSFGP